MSYSHDIVWAGTKMFLNVACAVGYTNSGQQCPDSYVYSTIFANAPPAQVLT